MSSVEPITATDAEIAAAVEAAPLPSFLPALLPAISHATGDRSLLRPDLRPDPTMMRDEHVGLSAAQQREIRDVAVQALIAFRDAGSQPVEPDVSRLRELMSYATGLDMPAEYVPLMEEELSVTGDDLRAPSWDLASLAPGRDMRVAVIGAGMSGILAAHRLGQAGIPYVVFDKNDDVGGTWLENTYPGCRVDVPNHTYSYSFAQRNDWPWYFSPQAELLDYFRSCADRFAVTEHIRFRHEVTAMSWSDVDQRWTLDVATPGGDTTDTFDAVISAVGQLNRPKLPDIAGRESFRGPAFHTAQWDHDVDLTGKRVVVIGSGASAAQAVPLIAAQAEHLSILQRTPNWFVPVPNYHEPVADGLNWLCTHVPGYAQWYRFWLFWRGSEGLLSSCTVDPTWTDVSLATGPANLELRGLLEMWLEIQYADRPDLLDKTRPMYPPAAKRIVLDNGSWGQALHRDDVTLCVEPIERIDARGVVVTLPDGTTEHIAADVLIYATGFQASKFLTPMHVAGSGGRDLHDIWDGDARAYLGVVHPGFPNFFMLYGPNTNIVVNGSIIYFSECEVHYLLGCVESLLRNRWASIDCRAQPHEDYNERIDAGNLQMAWGVSTVSSWYKNDSGRVAQNWPFSLLEYWQQTRAPDPDDYVVVPLSRSSEPVSERRTT